MRKWWWRITVSLMVIALIAGGFYWYRQKNIRPDVSYLTTKIERGDLRVTINATGTVEPEEVVDVGAQVAGKITEFGHDAAGKLIDYGSVVKKGCVLAHIDDALYQAEWAKAKAEVAAARAGLLSARADLQQVEAKLLQSKPEWERAGKLAPQSIISRSTYDAAKAAYEQDLASRSVCEAAIKKAEAALLQAQAAADYDHKNLEYCTIISPVDGVIIDRRVNVGQTVVSSMSAPSLFLLAKDLRQMEVWVSVNEADIGKIYVSQPVTFTVDAFPGETFVGEVGKIRLNASLSSNVVTYIVEVKTDNASGRLLPYLSANVQFELSNQHDITYVANAALRWTPEEGMVDPEIVRQTKAEAKKADTGKTAADTKKAGDKTVASAPAAAASAGDNHRHVAEPTYGTLWVAADGYVHPVTVITGPTNGSVTQVSGDKLPLNLPIVTGVKTAETIASGAASPFLPKLPSRRRNGKKSSSSGGASHH
ncbi:MAG: efflux RND transporter periplasmic adaptor subunit [Victivallales bacterium]|nr:efflux RND transporter periplasmic adaptor subunit [Victivallales bacterium]